MCIRDRDEAECNRCLQTTEPVIKDTTIQDWRTRHLQLLNAADRVLTPTRDVKQRMLRYTPAAHLVFAPHPETRSIDQQPSSVPLAATEPLRIVVLGALSQAKGADVLEACAIDARRRALPLTFHPVSYTHLDVYKRQEFSRDGLSWTSFGQTTSPTSPAYTLSLIHI